MHELVYISSGGDTFDLDVSGDDLVSLVGRAETLRGWKRDYELGARDITGVSRKAREIKLQLSCSYAAIDRLFEAIERDVEEKTPGELVHRGWRQRVYVIEGEVVKIHYGAVTINLTVILLDGVWHKQLKYSFFSRPQDAGVDLDHPYDLPADLGAPAMIGSVEIPSMTKSPVKLTIFGQAVNPRIVIGKNVYAFDLTIPTGARLEVDATKAKKTIRLISSQGDATDSFDSGARGEGPARGMYCFEPIEPGYSAIQYDGTFGFDLEIWQLRGGLPWSDQSSYQRLRALT